MSKKKKSVEELLDEAVVSEDEQPYEIPENWVWATLESINEAVNPNINPSQFPNEQFILYSVPSFENGFPERAYGYEIKSNKKIVNTGDVLVSKINPRINRVWVVEEHDNFRILASTEWIIIKSKYISSSFLEYYFKSPYFRNKLCSNVSGVGGSLTRAKPKEVMKYGLPLAPIDEQEKISNKIEIMFTKIEEAERLITEAKETFELRRASIINKAFSGELTAKWRTENSSENVKNLVEQLKKEYPKNKFEEIPSKGVLPETWKCYRMADVIEINPPKDKLENISDEEEVSFVPMPAVSDKLGIINAMESREYVKVKKGYTYFKENDVLFAKITPCMENGKCAVANNLKNGFGFGSTEFHVLRTSKHINTKYVHYLLRSKKFRGIAQAAMTGAVGQQRVPKSFLEDYPFPLPPKKEQDKIVEILDDLKEHEYNIQAILEMEEQINLLKQSILSIAFQGELGTNDPSKESAIELLKSVLQEKL